MDISPFEIAVDDDQLLDLKRRLKETRFPDASPADEWEAGSDLEFMRRLTDYWESEFDWRAQERDLNRLPQYTAELDGITTHFIHERGKGPDPFPLIIGHGWPGTNFDLRRIIPILTDPGSHGGDPADAFDVVAPSLPGYGFSQRPDRPGVGPAAVAPMWAELMRGLGYEKFGVQSGDWGAAVAIWLASTHPDQVTAFHLNFIPGFFQPPLGDGDPPLTDAERNFRGEMGAWFDAEGGYHRLQSTRPQTPAYGLTDSPAGLAAWIVEKMRGWSDCHGSIEEVFTLDEVLTNVSIFWFTATIGSSMRFYRENRLRPNHFSTGERVEPPLGFAGFPATEPVAPRSWLERVFNVTRYTTIPDGGHFGPWEEPGPLAQEVRDFFRPLRSGSGT